MGKDKEQSPEIKSGSMARLDLGVITEAISKSRQGSQEEEQEQEGDGGADLQEDLAPELAELGQAAKFSEKKIRNMIKAPFELAYILTNIEGVRITDPEINLILEDTVDVMNYFVKVNPIYLAIFGLLANGGAITWSKIEIYKKEMQRRAEIAKTKQP